ncbi:MAG: hypothetical protein KF851_14970 [Pirellulaceae bacterium]|nr:hypothetical protein [Pirellulaceae bacterium]
MHTATGNSLKRTLPTRQIAAAHAKTQAFPVPQKKWVALFVNKWVAPFLLCLLLFGGGGCAHKGKTRTSCALPPVEIVEAKNELRLIPFADRAAMQLPDLDQTILGWPIADSDPEKVRQLHRDECRRLGQLSSPLANQIMQHREWLSCRLSPQHPLVLAMTQRENYERALHAAKSEETLLNLMQIYAVQPLIAESREILAESSEVVKKFRDNGFSIPGDTSELERQELQLDQKLSELKYQQQRATGGLEFLLHLNTDSRYPIWGEMGTQPNAELQPIDFYLVSATCRGDLQAIETLAGGAHQISEDSLSGFAGSPQPLLGITPGFPGPAKFWQCALKAEIECLKQQTSQQRQRQLLELAALKRREIEMEVRDAHNAVVHHTEVSELKYREIEILFDSIVASEKAKDETPLDFAQHLERRMQLMQLTAEFLAERIQVEIHQVRLNAASGLQY